MNINCWGENVGTLCLDGTDERMLKLVKTRQRGECLICEKQISPKSYCLGSGYAKICIECYKGFLDTFTKSLDSYKEKVKCLAEEIEGKHKDIIKNNVLAKVGDTNTND